MDILQQGLNTIQAVQAISGKHNVKVRKKDDMTSKSVKYSHFAKAAYGDVEKVKGYTLLKDLSTDEIKVYRNPKGKVVIASRGTTVDPSLKDVKSDLVLAQGKEPVRVQELRDKVNAVKKKLSLSNNDIKLTGHSLGAYISSIVGSELGVETHSYNPGSTSFGSKENQKKLAKMINSEHVHTNIIQGDPVSAALLKHAKSGAKVQVIDAGTSVKKAHSMANFIKGSGIKAGNLEWDIIDYSKFETPRTKADMRKLYQYGFQLNPNFFFRKKQRVIAL
jgi:hypothetical protein